MARPLQWGIIAPPFSPHPDDPAIFYASGHPASGGNLGFIVSTDGGKSWEKLADGVGGPVDFHQMDVSKADPNIVFGNSRDLQHSKDGGLTWSMVGPAPEGTIDIAAYPAETTEAFCDGHNAVLSVARTVDVPGRRRTSFAAPRR